MGAGTWNWRGGPVPSQAFLGEEGSHQDAGRHRHPHQQPLLEALLRPSALSRGFLPKDFSKTLLEEKNGEERVNPVWVSGGSDVFKCEENPSAVKFPEIPVRLQTEGHKQSRWIPSLRKVAVKPAAELVIGMTNMVKSAELLSTATVIQVNAPPPQRPQEPKTFIQ